MRDVLGNLGRMALVVLGALGVVIAGIGLLYGVALILRLILGWIV